MLLRHAGIAVATLLITSAARSTEPQRPVRFDYEAEPGCPDESAWVTSTLSRAPAARIAAPDEAAWTLKARIVREGNRFAGRLQVVTPDAVSDTRRFRGNSCEQVALALAIAAALSVDPEHGGAAPAAKVESAPTVEPPPAPPAPPAPPEVRPPERAPAARVEEAKPPTAHWSFRLGVSALATHAIIDSTMWGGELVAHVRPDPAPVALRFSAGYAQSPTVEAPPGGARFYLPNLAVEGCVFAVDSGPFALGPCGGARGGALLASGLGVDRPSDETRGWLSWIGGLRAEVGPPLGVRAEIAASLVVRQTRYTYTFDRPPVIITDPPLLGWELSLGVMLPR